MPLGCGLTCDGKGSCGSYSGGSLSGRTSSVRVCHVYPLYRSNRQLAQRTPGQSAVLSLTYRPRRVFATAHEHRAITPTSIIRSEADIGAQHRARLAKQILQVLPSDPIRQLSVSVLLPRTGGPCAHCQGSRVTHVAHKQVHSPVRTDSGGQEIRHERCDGPTR